MESAPTEGRYPNQANLHFKVEMSEHAKTNGNG